MPQVNDATLNYGGVSPFSLGCCNSDEAEANSRIRLTQPVDRIGQQHGELCSFWGLVGHEYQRIAEVHGWHRLLQPCTI